VDEARIDDTDGVAGLVQEAANAASIAAGRLERGMQLLNTVLAKPCVEFLETTKVIVEGFGLGLIAPEERAIQLVF
jgi:hypothetical protein